MNITSNLKRRAGIVALSAALLGGAAPAATAVAATSNAGSAAVVVADNPVGVVHGDFFWNSDCQAAGQRGVDAGMWEVWECRDGGPFPGQYYTLYSNR